MTRRHPIPDEAMAGHLAVLGTSGYGKTNAIKGRIERSLAADHRVVIVDPTGVWWGMRLTADGKRPSPYPLVIFGGRHGDLPLGEADGDRLAQVLGTSTTPAILDTQQMSVAARTRFFTAFAETILRENRGPLLLVLDEAHLFAPQSGGTGLLPALVHATNNLVALGRSAGISVVMITQRAAKLHKDALSQAASLVVMGLIDPRDQDAAAAWLKGAPDQSLSKEILASLAGLPIGTGWVYAPRLGVLEKAAFPLVTTFDSGRPEANADAPALKPLDVGALRQALAAGADLVDKPAETKPLVAKEKAALVDERPASAAEIAAAERRAFREGVAAGIRVGWANARGNLLRHADAFPAAPDADHLAEMVAAASGDQAAPALPGGRTSPAPAPLRDSKTRARRTAIEPAADGTTSPPALTPSLQRALDALGWWRAAGFPMVHRARAAVTAGYSPKASTFGVYVSDLVKRGLVETGSGTIGLTDAGLLCADVPAHVTAEDLRSSARALLKPQEARAFDVIYATGGKPIRRDDVATALGLSPTASTAGVYISAVAAYGLIEAAGRGEVRAAPWLFEVQS